MKTSEKTEALIAALLKARAAFPVITKDKTAKVPTKSGGQYQYNYADLSSIIDGTKAALLENGLLLQHGMESNGHTILTCRLSHISGQWQESGYPIYEGVDAQQMGSAITYGRRYTACAMLGIVTEDDDDGAQATRQTQQQAAGAPRPYNLKPVAPVKPPPAPQADEDRVPPEVTDGQAEAGDMRQATIVATSKGRSEKTKAFGILVLQQSHAGDCKKNNQTKTPCSCGAEVWWNTFHENPWTVAKSLKGQLGVFTLKTNEQGYTNVEHLVGVQG